MYTSFNIKKYDFKYNLNYKLYRLSIIKYKLKSIIYKESQNS